MKKFISVCGTHGSGKTSLVKSLLISDDRKIDGDFLFDCFDFFEKKSDFGIYSVSKGEKYVAVGGYSNKCGGSDLIKETKNYYGMINFLSEKYLGSNLCTEGVIIRSVNDTILLYEELKKKGFDEHIVRLDVSFERAVERVKNRNLHVPNVKYIRKKISETQSFFQKLQDYGKFNCHIIDTENKSKEQVYEEFEKIIL